MPYYLLLPLAAAILYTLSSMLVKRGFEEGARTTPTFHLANLMGAVLFSPLFFFGDTPVSWHSIYQPLIVGFMIYVGGWLTFMAVNKGDVSLVTPILGTKVIIVAVAAVLIAELARACKHLPEAAMPLYVRLVAHEVQGGKNAAYRRAVAWMLEAEELVKTGPDRQVFDATLDEVRERFKLKRNFIQFLDAAFSDQN